MWQKNYVAMKGPQWPWFSYKKEWHWNVLGSGNTVGKELPLIISLNACCMCNCACIGDKFMFRRQHALYAVAIGTRQCCKRFVCRSERDIFGRGPRFLAVVLFGSTSSPTAGTATIATRFPPSAYLFSL
jgi:hypothetical protein